MTTPATSSAVRRVVDRRLSTQRLTSAPLASAAEVVRLLGCVQSQDRPSAFYSLGLRTRAAIAGSVQAELDAGAIIRTHILRPTWHFVAPEDLRWMLALTSPKIIRGMAARHRELALDERTIDGGMQVVAELLRGKQYLSRKQLGPLVAGHGITAGPQLGHLLLLAELRGLICSGPSDGGQHRYALIDEWVPSTAALDADQATARLVHRFFAGHGPASLPDLTRWCTVTQAEARIALAEIGDALERIEVDGTELWFDPSVTARRSRKPEALLLPVFDEATLTYLHLSFPRTAGHPFEGMASPGMGDLFSGSVLVDAVNVGTYSRTVGADHVQVRLRFAGSATAEQRRRAKIGAERIGAFHGRAVEIVTQ